jgi:quinol monooxygenase YgiN
MTFRAEEVERFLEIFRHSRARIRGFDGCTHLTLLTDAAQPNVFTTYSHWQSEAHLEQYRHSELFKTTWAATKVLFAEKPQAHSYFTVIANQESFQ